MIADIIAKDFRSSDLLFYVKKKKNLLFLAHAAYPNHDNFPFSSWNRLMWISRKQNLKPGSSVLPHTHSRKEKGPKKTGT